MIPIVPLIHPLDVRWPRAIADRLAVVPCVRRSERMNLTRILLNLSRLDSVLVGWLDTTPVAKRSTKCRIIRPFSAIDWLVISVSLSLIHGR
jgi:hypothetical protein